MRRSVRYAARGLAVLAVGAVAAVGAVGGVLLGFGAPASAHVTAQADEAVPGSTARVVFRMPNESDAAPSTRLEVHLRPEGAPPIAAARAVPVPGWDVEVEYETLDEPIQGAHGEEITEAASVVTWTAEDEDAAIQPGQVGEFPVLIGPLPEVEELFFPALQSYAGVEEPVRWIAPPEADGSEPDNPAPVLRLASEAADPEATDPAATDPDATAPDGAADGSGDGEDGGGTAGVWFGLAGLVAGLAGLALGGAAFARTRR